MRVDGAAEVAPSTGVRTLRVQVLSRRGRRSDRIPQGACRHAALCQTNKSLALQLSRFDEACFAQAGEATTGGFHKRMADSESAVLVCGGLAAELDLDA